MRREDAYLLISAVVAVLVAVVAYVVMRRDRSSRLESSAISSVIGLISGVFWPFTAMLLSLAGVAFAVGSIYEGLQWVRMWLSNKLGVKDD